jgi:hypothetical protein
MSEETITKDKSDSVLSDEEMLKFKQAFHQKLGGSISFAEVIQVVNGMLLKEVDERITSMSAEELISANSELCGPENQNEPEDKTEG